MCNLGEINEKSILVLGDVMLDTYCVGRVKRISPEAPVPVFLKSEEYSVLGGAANVAINLVAAKQKVSLMSIVGDDVAGERLRALCADNSINSDSILSSKRKTTVKTRFLADNNQQIMRLDNEDAYEISEEEVNKLISIMESKIDKFNLIIISDYLKGLLTVELVQGVIKIANEKGIPVLIDVKDTNVDKYKGAYLLKPNLNELRSLTGTNAQTADEIVEASIELQRRCGCKYVLTTCGARGMLLVSDADTYFINSVGKEVFDVTGAGDTTIAYLASGIANGIDIKDSVDLANLAAGIQVGKVGTSAVYLEEIVGFNKDSNDNNKIITDVVYLSKLREDNRDKKIVFTNGCFDIIHTGHVRYLQEAAKLGDILVIGLNTDASVKRLKGEDRPINAERDRAEVLCALGCVDYVVMFDEDTPYNLIKTIEPDVLVKGGDYRPEEVVGREIVEEKGGELVLIPYVDGKSTTNIIGKIKR